MARAKTLYEQVGLSITYADPLPKAERAGYLGNLTFEIDTYEHEIDAAIGFVSAQITFTGDRLTLEDWLLRGLGRDIRVACGDMTVAWEGFVDLLTFSKGNVSIEVGPLTSLINRLYVRYTPLDTSTNPPMRGPAGTPTTIADHADSQGLYGIWERAINGGEREPDVAEQLRDSELARLAWPQKRFSEASGEVGITLDCRGYGEWLKAFVYDQTTSTGTRTLTDKIGDVLDADPNGIVSSDRSHLAANAVLTPYYTNPSADGSGWDTILPLLGLGGSDYLRWTFGVFAERIAHYGRVPFEVLYAKRTDDPTHVIRGEGGAFVDPWRVRPAQWLFYEDILPLVTEPAELIERNRDPRYEFIERVHYTAPWGFEHEGGTVETGPQLLAQLGLGSSA